MSSLYYEEVEIEDMTYSSSENVYTYPCPCGDNFVITLEELWDGEDVAPCPSCTLVIKVIYEEEDLEPLEDSDNDDENYDENYDENETEPTPLPLQTTSNKSDDNADVVETKTRPTQNSANDKNYIGTGAGAIIVMSTITITLLSVSYLLLRRRKK